MRTYFTMLLLAAIVTFLATPFAQRLAFVIGAIDKPDPRKIHRDPTPRTGGIAVLLGFCAPWAMLYLIDNPVSAMFYRNQGLFLTLIGCGLAMFALGIVDDILSLDPRLKFVVQIGIAIVMYFGGFRIDEVSNPITGQPIQLNRWIGVPLTVLWIVGITNATNLLDGMDGLVAGVAAVMALSLAMINIMDRSSLVALLTLTLAGASLGFLPYNFTPARIFLGDSGSLFIGVMMAGISTLSLFKAATATFVFSPLLLFAIPLFDTTQVVIGRLRRGRHPFSPDKTHVHHRLLRLGLNQRQAAFFLYTITLFLGVASILLSGRISPAAYATLAIIAAVIGIAFVAVTRRLARRRTPKPLPSANTNLHPSATPPQDPPGK